MLCAFWGTTDYLITAKGDASFGHISGATH
jgi:hypothetical protein